MAVISFRNGLKFKFKGAPALDVVDLASPTALSLSPERIPFIKPRLLVAEGDRVLCGSPLVADKRNPDVTLAAPAGGRIVEVRLGPRRVIQEIIIEPDAREEFLERQPIKVQQVATLDRRELLGRLMEGGLWPLMRQLPFRDYARPDRNPRVIIVALDSQEPFHPDPQCYLKGREALFEFGLALLDRFGAERMEVTFCGDPDTLGAQLKKFITQPCAGHFPVGDPGVTLYRTKRSSAENRSWFIRGQDLLLWAEFIQTGRYPTERVVAVGGNLAGGNRHVRTRLGAPLAHLLGNLEPPVDQRLLVGGLFSGYSGAMDGYLGLLETSLVVVPEGNQEEFLALFNPGIGKPTFSRLYASRLAPGIELAVDCNKHGGDRACIACMHCADACPVDILPQLVYKSILVEEVEEYLAHGLLDCVECGLCSYVCPSKIELTAILKSAKAEYLKDYNWQQD